MVHLNLKFKEEKNTNNIYTIVINSQAKNNVLCSKPLDLRELI